MPPICTRIFILLAWTALATPAAVADTLPDAIGRAVANLPEVRAARANLRASEEGMAQARGAWYPTLDASLGQGRETSDNPSTRVLGSDQTLTRTEAELNLSQLIYDGGAASGQVRRFQARALVAGDQLAQTAELAGLHAAEAYLDVMRLRTLIDLAAENEKRHAETLRQVSRLADAGQGRRADAQQAEARLALSQASLTQLRNQLAQAEASFLHLTGRPPSTMADVSSYRAALPATLPVALAQALATHPTVRAAQNELQAAQADLESVRSRRASPRLALELGTSANHDLDGVRGHFADRYAMLRLRYNLLRGGIDDARVREARARVDEAIANYGKARNDVERDLRQAWQGLLEDRVRLPQLQRYATASAQVVGAYRRQFSIGQRSLLDVLNAENEQYSAKGGEYAGQHAVKLGELRVLAAMGRLLETLGVGLDGAPQTRLAHEAPNVAKTIDGVSHRSSGIATMRQETGAAPPQARDAAKTSKGRTAALDLRLSSSLDSATSAVSGAGIRQAAQ